MAAEAGTRLDLDDIDRAARSTPVIADLMPSGRYSAVEMFEAGGVAAVAAPLRAAGFLDRKSTRLNSSHVAISYAVFCLKKKKRRGRSNSASILRSLDTEITCVNY